MEIDNSEYNKPENIEARKIQEDPIVMYLIVNDIGMSAGKIAAQVGHAVGMLYGYHHKLIGQVDNCITLDEEEYNEYCKQIDQFDQWKRESFRKVVLKCTREARWKRSKEELHCVVVKDAGLTEVEPGSETVIGVWPMRKSERPNFLRKLQALK